MWGLADALIVLGSRHAIPAEKRAYSGDSEDMEVDLNTNTLHSYLLYFLLHRLSI